MEENNVERFNFDYDIDDYRVRLSNVVQYLKDNEDDIEYMTSSFIDRLGSYILFAYDKEIKHEKENINTSQYRVLVDNERGLKTHVNNVQRQINQNKKNKVERTEENQKHILNNLESIFVADDNIKAYERLIKLCDELGVHGQKQSLYDDIGATKRAFILSEVKSKNEVQMSYETLQNLDVQYNSDTIKILLRSFTELEQAEPYSDAHCIYMDLVESMKKCKFTSNQKNALHDYISGISRLHIQTLDLDLAIKKIIKNL